MQLLPLVRAVRSALQDWCEENRTRAWVGFFTKAYGRPPYDEEELKTFAREVTNART